MYQIEDYSNYEMDDDGKIYSKERVVLHSRTGTQKVPFKLRKPIKHNTGYYVISLKNDTEKKTKTLRYHIIVAKTLVPNPDNKPYVNHIDGNKLNFHPSNLEWVTAKENTQHAIVMGLTSDGIGVNNNACRFTVENVESWLKWIKEGGKIKEITKEYKCGYVTIVKLINIHFPNQLPKYNGNYRTRFNNQNEK